MSLSWGPLSMKIWLWLGTIFDVIIMKVHIEPHTQQKQPLDHLPSIASHSPWKHECSSRVVVKAALHTKIWWAILLWFSYISTSNPAGASVYISAAIHLLSIHSLMSCILFYFNLQFVGQGTLVVPVIYKVGRRSVEAQSSLLYFEGWEISESH